MLKFRAISFTLLLALLALAIFWEYGKVLFFALAIPAAVMLALEILRMLAKAGLPGHRGLAVVLAGYGCAASLLTWILLRLVDYQWVVYIMQVWDYLLTPMAAMAIWLLILFAGKKRLERIKELAVGAGVAVFALTLIVPLLTIYQTSSTLFLYFVLTTKAGDTGGYIAGKLTSMLPGGNHKVVPSISPAKSWEGVGGGLALSIGVSLLFAGCGWVTMPWWRALLLGVILYGGGFAGDLSESALKRACGVKDAGGWIPGMGGVFDVVDSFIYNGPVFMVILMVDQLVENI